ncbi:hypothetical protein ACH4C2_12815 [Streptomyces sp. NPDC018057]|uniref:hypothetical protein n=1 Tax=unclassified Streptomyces TaxID=2593676 RepID=UPI00379BE351
MPTLPPPPSADGDRRAIRVPLCQGLAALAILGARAGAVVEAPRWQAMFYFVPASTEWDVPDTAVLPYGISVPIPPARRTGGAGPYWRVCPGDGNWITDPHALRAALADAALRTGAAA